MTAVTPSGEQLAPCPFCGSTNISSGESLVCDKDELGKQTGCYSCGALGPVVRVTDDQACGPDGDELADAAWNRRTSPASPAVPVEMAQERIDALLNELDDIAREYDHYEFGLPMYDAHDDDEETPLNKMREAVRSLLREAGERATDGAPAARGRPRHLMELGRFFAPDGVQEVPRG